MLRITEAKVETPYMLEVAFSDGVHGCMNLRELSERGVFRALRNETFQRKLYIDAESGTITWPGGLDLDPVVLYSRISGRSIEEALHRYYART